mgnify:CR=1 FL=1
MNKAVFLDRDGVLIRERGDYNYLPEHNIINDGVVEALKMLQEKKYLLIVVSNQSGIAKGIYSYEMIEKFHDDLLTELRKHGITLSEIYYCPHHPEHGLCLCRKPLSLMIEKGLARFDVDAARSFLIGDAERDIEAAEAAGVKAVRIIPNQNLVEVVSKIIP